MKDHKELRSGASGAMLMKIFGMGVGYLFTVTVTRRFGTDVWGAFTLALTVLTIASIFGRLGVDTAILRETAGARGKKQQLSLQSVVTTGLILAAAGAFVVSIFLFVGASAVAGFFRKPHLTADFRIASLGVLPLALGLVSSQILRGLGRIRSYVFFDLVARFLAPLCILPFLTSAGNSRITVLIAYIIGAYVVLAANLVVLAKVIRSENGVASPAKEPFSDVAKRLYTVGIPLFLASSIVYLNGWIDTTVLGIFGSESDVGIYTVALKLATLVSLPLMAVNAVAAPKFAEAHAAGEMGRLSNIVEHSNKLIGFASIPIALGLCVFSRPVLSVFSEEAVSGRVPLIILTVGLLISALAGSVGPLLNMTGGQIAFRNITFAALGIKIVLNLLLTPRYGAAGAATSSSIGLVIWNLLCVYHIRQHLHISGIAFVRAKSHA